MIIFKKLVAGEYSLGKTYWIFGVLVNILAGIPIKFYEISSPEHQKSFLYVFIIFLIALIIYNFMASVGLWNSATKYSKSSFLKYLAKFISVVSLLGVLAVSGLIVKQYFDDNLKEASSTAFDFYECTNRTAKSVEDCGLVFVGTKQYLVDLNKNQVLEVAKDAQGYQKINELKNCSILDSRNWKCLPPFSATAGDNGIIFFSSPEGLEMRDGSPRILHPITISQKGSVTLQTLVVLVGELRKK